MLAIAVRKTGSGSSRAEDLEATVRGARAREGATARHLPVRCGHPSDAPGARGPGPLGTQRADQQAADGQTQNGKSKGWRRHR